MKALFQRRKKENKMIRRPKENIEEKEGFIDGDKERQNFSVLGLWNFFSLSEGHNNFTQRSIKVASGKTLGLLKKLV